MLSRRQLNTAALGIALATLQRAKAQTDTPTASASAQRNYPFSLGVASGLPRPDSVLLWTRLGGDFLEICEQCQRHMVIVRYEIYSDVALRKRVQIGQVTAHSDAAFSVHIHAQGLQAGQDYWYRFILGDAVSPVGHTRTAPALHAKPQRLRLALASCQNFEQGYFVAQRDIAQQELDAVLFVGDYIYEGMASKNLLVAPQRRHSKPAQGNACKTLADYRARHAQYKGDPDLQAAHAAHPWIMTWDDHEVSNDYANDLDQAYSEPQAFLQRRAAAYQAYFEHMPLLVGPVGSAMRIHERFTWGDLADLWTLDARQHRNHHACPDPIRGGGRVVLGCDALADPSRSMLGNAQEAWINDGLRSSKRRWKLLAQATLMASSGTDTPFGRTNYTDGWDGYPQARTRLLQSAAAAQVQGLVVLGGDIHQHIAANLRVHANDPLSPIIASEFVGTSVSSRGMSATLVQAMLTNNPDIVHARSDERGYALIECSPSELRCTMRATPHPVRQDAQLSTQAVYAASPDKAGVRKLNV